MDQHRPVLETVLPVAVNVRTDGIRVRVYPGTGRFLARLEFLFLGWKIRGWGIIEGEGQQPVPLPPAVRTRGGNWLRLWAKDGDEVTVDFPDLALRAYAAAQAALGKREAFTYQEPPIDTETAARTAPDPYVRDETVSEEQQSPEERDRAYAQRIIRDFASIQEEELYGQD